MNFSTVFTPAHVWLAVGFIGQFLFSMRFILQWLFSEKHKKSVIPDVFWHFSIAGGLTLLAYAIYRRDPVFIMGQASGVFIYFRNLYFIRKSKTSAQMSDAA